MFGPRDSQPVDSNDPSTWPVPPVREFLVNGQPVHAHNPVIEDCGALAFYDIKGWTPNGQPIVGLVRAFAPGQWGSLIDVTPEPSSLLVQ